MRCLNEAIARQGNAEDDCTGRVVRQDKRGAIPEHVPKLLVSLGLDASNLVRKFSANSARKEGLGASSLNEYSYYQQHGRMDL